MTNTLSTPASEKVRSAFDFTVDKFPLAGPDGLVTPWYGLFRSDTGGTVGEGSVTDRYVAHQTDDVIALVEACETVFDETAEVKTHFRNGHYVSLAPSRDYRRAIYGTRDNIFPRLIIRGGYDRSAFHVTLGTFRDACSNLMMLRSIDAVRQSIRHTSGLRDEMDELIGQFETLKEGWNTIESLCRQMEATEVNMVDFLNAVYPEPDADASQRAVTIHKNRTEKIFRRLQKDRVTTGRPTLSDGNFTVSAWEAYNSVQGFNQWDATRRSSFTGDFDRILKAADNPQVLRAERLAVEAIAA